MLTHKQAVELKAADFIEKDCGAIQLQGLAFYSRHYDGPSWLLLTPEGKQALAEYDAAHIIIPRALLAELEDFVAKWGCDHDYHAELLERTRVALKNP